MTECKYRDEAPTGAYHYTMCGLDNIWLLNGYEEIDDPDFGPSVVVHNADKLHIEIAKKIVQCKEKLDAKDLRFIRSILDVTQQELADKLMTNVRTIQRWESLNEDDLPDFPAESWIRIMFWDAFVGGNEKATKMLEQIRNARDHYKYLQFEESQHEWKLSA